MLHSRFEMHSMPGIEAYRQRALLLKEEWCPTCEGLKLVRTQNSDFGLTQGQDWRECWDCGGSGRRDRGHT
jgi:hypothetical protein